MSRKLKILGGILLVLGVLFFLGGVAADNTQTTTTCYDGYYTSGCVDTTYQNPAASMGPIFIGIGLGFVGLLLIGTNRSPTTSGVSNDLKEELERRQQ